MLAWITLGSGLYALTAQQLAPSAPFTAAQAETGRLAYAKTCGQCHTPTLLGRKGGNSSGLPPIKSLSTSYQEFIGPKGWVPPLAGREFLARWGSKTAAQLIARFQETVDYFDANDGSDETTVALTAYILQVNGAKAGSQPLTRSTATVVDSVAGHF